LSQTVCSLATGLFWGAAAGFVFTVVFLGLVWEKAAGTSKKTKRLITRDLINTVADIQDFTTLLPFDAVRPILGI